MTSRQRKTLSQHNNIKILAMVITAHKAYAPGFMNSKWALSIDFVLYINEPIANTRRKMDVVTGISHTAKYKVGASTKLLNVYLCDIQTKLCCEHTTYEKKKIFWKYDQKKDFFFPCEKNIIIFLIWQK